MAPNTVTLIGFAFMAAGYLCMLYYDTTFSKDLPRWTYFFASFCMFAYQTLDAVDGKHARTTKASSPLGQLFDHGCDSFSMTFIILMVCQAIRLGPSYELLFFSGLFQFAFFCANWSEYHSGVLTTNVMYFGVTEGQLLICASLLVAGIFGPAAWDASIVSVLNGIGLSINPNSLNPIIGWFLTTGFKIITLRLMYLTVIVIVVYFFITTLMVAKNKWLATRQFGAVAFLAAVNSFWSTLPVFRTNCAIIILSSALIFSLITSKLIIGSLTKMTIRVYQRETIIFLALGLFLKFVDPLLGLKHIDTLVLTILPLITTASVIQ